MSFCQRQQLNQAFFLNHADVAVIDLPFGKIIDT